MDAPASCCQCPARGWGGGRCGGGGLAGAPPSLTSRQVAMVHRRRHRHVLMKPPSARCKSMWPAQPLPAPARPCETFTGTSTCSLKLKRCPTSPRRCQRSGNYKCPCKYPRTALLGPASLLPLCHAQVKPHNHRRPKANGANTLAPVSCRSFQCPVARA